MHRFFAVSARILLTLTLLLAAACAGEPEPAAEPTVSVGDSYTDTTTGEELVVAAALEDWLYWDFQDGRVHKVADDDDCRSPKDVEQAFFEWAGTSDPDSMLAFLRRPQHEIPVISTCQTCRTCYVLTRPGEEVSRETIRFAFSPGHDRARFQPASTR